MITQFGSQGTRGSPGNNNSLRNASWACTCTHTRTNGLILSPNLPNTTTQQMAASFGIRKMHRRVRTRLARQSFGSNPVPITSFGSATSTATVAPRAVEPKPNIRATTDGTGSSSMTTFVIVTGPVTRNSTSTQTRSCASPTKTSRVLNVCLPTTTRCNSSQAETTMAKRRSFSSMSSVLQSSPNTSS